ncbi:MAG: hypothetical protein V4773_27685 [Verrucomicrobiota bacterium]
MIAHPPIRQQALLGNGQPMLLDIPDCDHEEWYRDVETEERVRIREFFAVFREMLAARNLKAGAASAALKRRHLGWGWSAKSFKQLFAVYRDGGYKPGDHRKVGASYPAGDWRVLQRTYKGKEPALPAEFVRWLNERWTEFKGRTDIVNAVWRHVVYDVWLVGKPVPTYGTVDDWCRRTGRARPHPAIVRLSELPAGWSEATFRRRLPKLRAVKEQMAHGYLAAHNAQPDQLLTDRSPLLPLQYIFLDDSRPDLRCTWFGPGSRGEMVYPLMVLGLDACSGVDLANCAKPRALKAADAETEGDRKARHGVTQDMALRVLVEILRKFGLPPWPITIVHENAAACIPPWAKRLLESLYGDRIRFEATGIFKEKMMAHGFRDEGGAPYDKAPIEAFFRLLMTQLARLPGSTGPRYDTAPGELKQIEKYTLGLMEKAGGLQEVFAKFQSPLLDFNEAHAAIEDALRILRFRCQHKLQGFDRIREWRRSPADSYRPWSQFLALPAEEQNAIAAAHPDNLLSRMECPAERFCRLLQGVTLTPVDGDLLTYIAGPRAPMTIRDGKVMLERTALTDDLLVFREGDHPLLSGEFEGRTLEGVLAPDLSHVVLAHDGRVLGSVFRQGRVVRGTPEWRAEMGRIHAARVADREHLRGYYLADTDDALAQLRAHNEAKEAAVAALPAPAAAPTTTQQARQQRTRQVRRARIDSELAAAARDAAQPMPAKGSLYGDSTEP